MSPTHVLVGELTKVTISGTVVGDGQTVVFLFSGDTSCEGAVNALTIGGYGGVVSSGGIALTLANEGTYKMCLADRNSPYLDAQFAHVAGVQLGAQDPTSPTPPSPSPPATVITFIVVAAGTVDSFDQLAFKASLAATLDGVSADDVDLEVSAASVLVTATVRAVSLAAADAALNTLSTIAASPAALSIALGVTVEEIVAMPAVVGSVSSQREAIVADDQGVDDSNAGVIIGAVVGAVIVLGLIGFLGTRNHFKKKPTTTTAGSAVVMNHFVAPSQATASTVVATAEMPAPPDVPTAVDETHTKPRTSSTIAMGFSGSVAAESNSAQSQPLLATFAAGPLGLGLSNRGQGAVAVTSVDEGSAAQAQGVRMNSVVVEVSGESTSGLDKVGVLAKIKSVPRPLTLKFVQPDAHVASESV